MEIGDLLLLSAIIIWVFMTVVYFISLLIKNASVADLVWPIGFMVTALGVQQAVGDDITQAFMWVWLLVIIWGSRLALHIATRFDPKKEDWRYAQWREEKKGYWWWFSYLQVFMLQGVMMWLIALPIVVANFASEVALWQLMLGVTVWFIGFYFEAVGDWQLRKFISDKKNKGKIITTGLWKYTRHPNYFGEVTQWWGIFIILAGQPYCWLAIISPIVISLLILKVSGIPMLEKKWQGNKQWEKYAAKTSVFFPLPPKK